MIFLPSVQSLIATLLTFNIMANFLPNKITGLTPPGVKPSPMRTFFGDGSGVSPLVQSGNISGIFGGTKSSLGQIIGTALGGVTSIFGQLLANRQNERLVDKQFANQLALQRMQNAYNSPANQIELLKKAGLNPALMYKTGSGFIQASNASAPSPIPAQNILSGAAPMIASMMSAMSAAADIKVKEQQAKNIAADTELKREQTESEAALRDPRKVLLDAQSQNYAADSLLKGVQSDVQMVSVDKIQSDIALLDAQAATERERFRYAQIQANRLNEFLSAEIYEMTSRGHLNTKELAYKSVLTAAQKLNNIVLAGQTPDLIAEPSYKNRLTDAQAALAAATKSYHEALGSKTDKEASWVHIDHLVDNASRAANSVSNFLPHKVISETYRIVSSKLTKE